MGTPAFFASSHNRCYPKTIKFKLSLNLPTVPADIILFYAADFIIRQKVVLLDDKKSSHNSLNPLLAPLSLKISTANSNHYPPKFQTSTLNKSSQKPLSLSSLSLLFPSLHL